MSRMLLLEAEEPEVAPLLGVGVGERADGRREGAREHPGDARPGDSDEHAKGTEQPPCQSQKRGEFEDGCGRRGPRRPHPGLPGGQ